MRLLDRLSSARTRIVSTAGFAIAASVFVATPAHAGTPVCCNTNGDTQCCWYYENGECSRFMGCQTNAS